MRPAAEYHGRPRLSSDLHVYMYIKCKIIQRISKKYIYIYNAHVCVACTTVMFTRTYLVLILEEERSWCTQLLSSEVQSVPSAR